MISECLGVNLKTVQMIRKELSQSNGDYKGTAAWKPHSNRPNKKKKTNFLVRSML